MRDSLSVLRNFKHCQLQSSEKLERLRGFVADSRLLCEVSRKSLAESYELLRDSNAKTLRGDGAKD
jgi:hypothetical protein